jgi:hypothetical protein
MTHKPYTRRSMMHIGIATPERIAELQERVRRGEPTDTPAPVTSATLGQYRDRTNVVPPDRGAGPLKPDEDEECG